MLITSQDFTFIRKVWSKNKAGLLSILCLIAVGIGALTIVLSLVDRLLLRPFPQVEKIEEIVRLYGVRARAPDNLGFLAYSDYIDYSKEPDLFSELASFVSISLNVARNGQSTHVAGLLASDNYFEALGVKAALGETLEAGPSLAPRVVLTNGIWKRGFGSDSTIVGSALTINGTAFVISGVTPPGFHGIDMNYRPEIFLSLSAYQQVASKMIAKFSGMGRKHRWLEVVGRLAPKVEMSGAQNRLDAVSRRLETDYPETNRGRSVRVLPLSQVAFGATAYETIERHVRTFMILASAILLIACFNVASLLFVRGVSREKELTLRVALGASRSRLVVFMLIENALIALLGGIGGFALAYCTSSLVENMTLPGRLVVDLDMKLPSALGFALIASIVSVVFFGLWPALRSVRLSLSPQLGTAASSRRIGRHLEALDVLIVLQLTMTMVVLVASALLVQTVVNLERIDTGFSAGEVLLGSLELDSGMYDRFGVTDFYSELVEKLFALPEVRSVGLVAALPLLGAENLVDASVTADNVPAEVQSTARYVLVGGDYFSAVGLNVVTGRSFDARDTRSSHLTVIVNETLAKKYWPDLSPLGQQIRLIQDETPYEVIGVVRDSKHLNIKEEDVPIVYLWHGQQEMSFVGSMLAPAMTLVLRSSSDPIASVPAVRRAVMDLDPNVPLSQVSSLRELLSSGISVERQTAVIFAFLAGIAIIITLTGLQGCLAQHAARRTHEVGVRLVCGASPWKVARQVVVRGMILASGGVVSGILASQFATRWIADRLYGVNAKDFGAYLAATMIITLTAFVISLLSARQVLRTDIVATLRQL